MSTAVSRFIIDGLKGGYIGFEHRDSCSMNGSDNHIWCYNDETGEGHGRPVAEVLIEPALWQAVSVYRGWQPNDQYAFDVAHLKFEQFTNNLFKGKTIEEALQAIE